jgi:hypothetical protein
VTYEDRIKEVVKEAMADGVVFTGRDMARIARDAYDEVTAETTRKMFGGAEEQQ